MAYRNGRFSAARSQLRPLTRLSCRRAKAAAALISRGNILKNASIFLGLKRNCGGNCHKIGPSFAPSRKTPEAKKFASGLPIFASRSICVM